MARKYGNTALALGQASGQTPATVENYLERLEGAGYSPAVAAALYQRHTFDELETLIVKGAAKGADDGE